MIGYGCRSGGCTGTVTDSNPRTINCDRCRAILKAGLARGTAKQMKYLVRATPGYREPTRVAAHKRRKPQFIQCDTCCDMPWARTPVKRNALGGTDIVVGYRCKECCEPYAPEPRPEPQSMLQSSAKSLAEAGEIFGSVYVKDASGVYQSAKNRQYKAASLARRIAEAERILKLTEWEETE